MRLTLAAGKPPSWILAVSLRQESGLVVEVLRSGSGVCPAIVETGARVYAGEKTNNAVYNFFMMFVSLYSNVEVR